MRSYPALRTVAFLIKILAVLGVAGAFLVAAAAGALSSSSDEPGVGIAIAIYAIGGALFGGLFAWATAELLLVFANMGEDIGRLVQLADALDGQQHRSASASGSAALSGSGRPDVVRSDLQWTRAGNSVVSGPEGEYFGEIVGEDTHSVYARRTGSSETVAFRRDLQRNAA